MIFALFVLFTHSVRIENLGTYPGSTSDAYDGTVDLHFSGSSVHIFYDLMTYDAVCENGPTSAGNSCGMHIHSGFSCEDASLVGGHYYGGNVAGDPWTNAVYSGASGELMVDYGLNADDAMCRAFVIHDSSGARITCAQIEDCDSCSSSETSTFKKVMDIAQNNSLGLSLLAIILIIQCICCKFERRSQCDCKKKDNYDVEHVEEVEKPLSPKELDQELELPKKTEMSNGHISNIHISAHIPILSPETSSRLYDEKDLNE